MIKHSFIQRAKGRVARSAMRSFSPVQAIYFALFSSAFRRERRAVAAGIAKHARDPELNEIAFALRKAVHTLEKGLTMRPRRPEFGLSLIGPALDGYGALVTRWPETLDTGEGDWLTSVLVEYFEATDSSVNPVLVEARRRFDELVALVSAKRDSGPRLPMSDTRAADFDALFALSQQRGSVRWYTPTPVPRDKVDAAIRVAQESPTACNRQPYRYILFDDAQSIAQVSAVPMGTRGWREQIPGIAVVVGDLSAYVDERDRHLIYIDSALSVQGFLLALESQGVATCVINWPDVAFREVQMRALLHLRPHERVIMLVAYGYPDPSGLVPYSAKRELESVREFRSL
jgi:nitroreductase